MSLSVRPDRVFTPPELADSMARAIDAAESRCIADYAAGSGRLLDAAEARYPNATIVGTDIDERIVRALRASHPTWTVSRADFLAKRFHRGVAAFSRRPTAVLLNPPYSCRGGTRVPVTLARQTITCSIAGAFVASATQRLRTGGVLVALLPESFLHSEKDGALRRLLSANTRILVLAHIPRPRFEGCSVRSVLVRIDKRPPAEVPDNARAAGRSCLDSRLVVSVYRGGLPVHEMRRSTQLGAVPFVHTTDLVDYNAHHCRLVSPFRRGCLTGPGVLIPRVGVPSIEHLVTIRRRDRIQLSDCVILISTRNQKDAVELRTRLALKLVALQQLYRGLGARYVTVGRLGEWLQRNCSVEIRALSP